MFYKKRKEAKSKELNDNRVQSETQISAAIDKAEQIADPAEKLLRLDKIRNDIDSELVCEAGVTVKKSDRAGAKALMGGMGATSAAVAGVVLLVTGPAVVVGIPVMLGGYIGSIFLFDKRKESAAGKLAAEANDHVQKMIALRAQVSDMTDAVIENNVKEISQSPLYGDVRALPGIAEKFADAAAKRIATEEVPPVEAAPVVEIKKPKSTKRKKPNYDKIKKVI